jgi:PEP-CTERM motif
VTFIKGIVGAAAMLIGLSAPSARAGYVVDLTQQGSNVVATGSGTIDTTGLTIFEPGSIINLIVPSLGIIASGLAPVTIYNGFTGPASFGSGGATIADSSSGDSLGIDAQVNQLYVPAGDISGHALSSSETWDNRTFSSLGVTPGTYKWTWGSGADQNFTLVVGAAAIPEPSTWAMMLLGFAGLGFVGYPSAGRRRTVVNA